MKQTDKKPKATPTTSWRNIVMSMLRYWWVGAIAIALVAVALLYKDFTNHPPISLKV